MKKKILFSNIILFLIMSISFLCAVVDGNYLFQIEAATQTTINAITNPQQGMMIYNSTTNRINYYNGTSWITLQGNSIYNSDGQLTNNRSVDLNTNNLSFINGNVAIGSITPNATLDINGSVKIDGIFYDKNGSVGTSGQVLTAGLGGIEWTSSVIAPYISNTPIAVTASTTVTITLNGENFIPSSAVTIPGFNGIINSINTISPSEIQVNITTGTAATFDIVISNNGILNTQWVGNGVALLQVN